MSKYKTVECSSPDGKLAQSIQKRLRTNRLGKVSLQENDIDLTPMSENKSIIFIKLPRNTQTHDNSFKASLYESSLKRLKQQQVTLIKESAIPSLQSKPNYEAFEEEAIRKALKETTPKKKQNLPNLNKLIDEQNRKHFSLIQKPSSKIDQDPEIAQEQEDHWQLDGGRKKSIFQVDMHFLGFTNLKQKYLELRQLSLRNQKKSQLLDKPQYRRYEPQKSLEEYESKFKMEKTILDHMNRYNRKDFFQTKVNGFKTRIYPHQKALSRHEVETKAVKKTLECHRKHEHVENFIRRKKRSYCPQNTISDYPHSTFELTVKEGEINPKTRGLRGGINPDNFEKPMECSPWQTDAEF